MGIFEFGHSVQCRVIYSQMNCCRWPVWSRRTDLVALSLWNITTRASRTLQPDAEWNAMSHPYWTLVAVKSTSCQVITQALALLSSVVAVHLIVCRSVALVSQCLFTCAGCGRPTCGWWSAGMPQSTARGGAYRLEPSGWYTCYSKYRYATPLQHNCMSNPYKYNNVTSKCFSEYCFC